LGQHRLGGATVGLEVAEQAGTVGHIGLATAQARGIGTDVVALVVPTGADAVAGRGEDV
jgi:hypothetical protein